MNKIFLSVLISFLFINTAYTQSRASDGQRAQIDSLNKKGYKIIRSNMAKALLMFVQAQQQAVKINYQGGLAQSLLNQAEILNQRGYRKRSMLLYSRALNISQNIHDEYRIANAELHISTVKRKAGDYAGARILLQHALDVYIKLDKHIDIVNAQLRLGLLASTMKQYDVAGQWYDKAYHSSQLYKDQYGEKKSYYDRGLLMEELNKPAEALAYFHRALRIDTLTSDSYGKALSYLEISKIRYKSRQLNPAQQYAELSFTNADSVMGNDVAIQAASLLVNISKQKHELIGVIGWQDKLLAINKLIADKERNDAVSFIDILKEQQESQGRYVDQLNSSRKISAEKSLLLVAATAILGLIIVLISRQKEGYHGGDDFVVKGNKLIRTFAVYDSDNRNAKPTGEKRMLEYSFHSNDFLVKQLSTDTTTSVTQPAAQPKAEPVKTETQVKEQPVQQKKHHTSRHHESRREQAHHRESRHREVSHRRSASHRQESSRRHKRHRR